MITLNHLQAQLDALGKQAIEATAADQRRHVETLTMLRQSRALLLGGVVELLCILALLALR